MFTINNMACIEQYSNYLDNSMASQEEEVEELASERGAFIARFNDESQIILSFADDKKHIRHFVVDYDKIKEMKANTQSKEGLEESYSNINEIFNHYKINRFLRQEEYYNNVINRFVDNKINIRSIEMYGINPETEEGQEALIKIANAAANRGEFFISKFIDSFKIDAKTETGQDKLIKIARLLAKEKKDTLIFKLICDSGINPNTDEGQDVLIKIAISLTQDNVVVSDPIKVYGINPKKPRGKLALIDIAQKIAKINPQSVASNIGNYQIDSEENYDELLYIANLISNVNINFVSAFIKNSNIKSKTSIEQDKLIEFAKSIAKVNPWEFYSNMEIFGIDATTKNGQKILFEIAHANLTTPERLLELQRYKLSDVAARQIIVLFLSSASDKDVNHLLKTLQEGDSQTRDYFFSLINAYPPPIQDILLRKKMSPPLNAPFKIFESMDPSLQLFLDSAKSSYEELEKEKVKESDKIPQINKYQENLVRFTGLAFLRASILLKEDQRAEISRDVQMMLQRAMGVQDLLLRDQLINQIFNNLSRMNTEEYKKILTLPSHVQLAAFLLANLNINSTLTSGEINELAAILNQRGKHLLKDGNFQKTILKGLLALLEDHTLEGSMKIKFIDTLSKDINLSQGVKKDNLKKVFRYLKNFIEIGEQRIIQECLLQDRNSFEFLNTRYMEIVQTLIPLQEDLQVKMEAFLDTLRDRDPALIFRYAAVLKPGSKLQELFIKAIEEQLNGGETLRSSLYRYESEHNLHLKHIFSRYPRLMEEWMQPIKKNFHSSTSLEALTVEECDDFYDLLACGTEVVGSCQSVDRNSDLNKCLLAYIIDGKNRLIAIKNERGAIKARAILRILIDQNTKEPVLFIEKIYPESIKPEWKDEIISMAIQKAQSLHLPLLRASGKESCSYPNPIESWGSPAPFEYVDAIDFTGTSIQPNGKFTIPKTFIIN